MTLTVNLDPEVERQLRQRAVESGKDIETVARELIERGVSCSPTLDEILAPFRNQVAASAISDDELTSLFEDTREESHRERQRNAS